MFSQRQIRDFIFETINDARNSGRPNEVCYIIETKTWYKTVSNDFADNGTTVLSTNYPNDHDLKWVKIKSPFEPWKDPVKSYSYSDPGNISHPEPGDRYIVKPSGSHDWELHDNEIATYVNESWEFEVPHPGDIVIVLDSWAIYKYIEDPDNPGSYIWVNILSDFVNVIDVSYSTLVNYVNNSQLKPGSYYRITDYHTTNWIDSNHSSQHTSDVEEIFILALTPSILASAGLSQKFPHDKFSYNINSVVKVKGTCTQSKNFSGDWGSTQTNLKRYTYFDATDRVETVTGNFTNDTTLNLPNVDVTNARIKVGNESRWRKIDGSEGVSYDGNDITLTESGLTFKYSDFGFEYRKAEFINLYISDDEYPTGKIYYREDTSVNVKADFDFRNFKVQKYQGSPTVGSYQDTDYYMYDSSDKLLWTDYDGNNQGYSSSENAALIEPISSSVNTSVFNTRYTAIRNVEHGKIKNVYNSSIFTGSNIDINNVAFIIFNANSKIIDTKIYSTKYIYTTGYAFNGSITKQVTLNNVEIINVFSNILFAGQNVQNSKITGSGYFYLTESVVVQESEVDLTGIKVAYGTHLNITNCNAKIANVNFDHSSFINLSDSDIIINGNNSSIQNGISKSKVNFNIFNSSTLTGLIDNSELRIDVYNSTIQGISLSKISGTLHDFNLDRNISRNAIQVSENNYKLPSIPLNILCNTGSNAINLELPDQPDQGLKYVIVDSGANAESNTININVSSSPAGGIVNTINGGTSRSISINYGILNVMYDNTAGWLVVTETIPPFPTLQVDKYDVDSTIEANKTITLSHTPDSTKHIDIYKNGLLLEEIEDYTISGDTITFTPAFPLYTGDKIIVKYYY